MQAAICCLCPDTLAPASLCASIMLQRCPVSSRGGEAPSASSYLLPVPRYACLTKAVRTDSLPIILITFRGKESLSASSCLLPVP